MHAELHYGYALMRRNHLASVISCWHRQTTADNRVNYLPMSKLAIDVVWQATSK